MYQPKNVGDSSTKSIEKRIQYAENRIEEARYIGWKMLEESWTNTLNQLHMLKNTPKPV